VFVTWVFKVETAIESPLFLLRTSPADDSVVAPVDAARFRRPGRLRVPPEDAAGRRDSEAAASIAASFDEADASSSSPVPRRVYGFDREFKQAKASSDAASPHQCASADLREV
jgi:hypothetical protein